MITGTDRACRISRNRVLRFLLAAGIFTGLTLAVPVAGHALEPHEILVVANRNDPESLKLAYYYMEQRGIWKKRLLELDTTTQEGCSRSEYNDRIAAPVRQYLGRKDRKVLLSCIVIMYGLPLYIHSSPGMPDSGASVDSELPLIFRDSYDLSGWVRNPSFYQWKKQNQTAGPPVLMVSRLDGPDPQSVRRIIDDSIWAERNGLAGAAYFDARWDKNNNHTNKAYGYYDQSLHLAAEMIRKEAIMPVFLDSREPVFGKDTCPHAALYCGWYSLARYVDAFEWERGAVGYHIASGECTTLKRKNSQNWCKMMIEKGVAATLGPVAEPYVHAFPPPELFFRLLTSGKYTLAETYMLSLPLLSWKMVLIGDPLYNPFFQTGKTIKQAVADCLRRQVDKPGAGKEQWKK